MIRLVICFVTVLLLAAGAQAQSGGSSPPAAASAGTLTPAQAQQALELLQDPAKRDQLIETLQTIAKAAPAAAKPATPSAPSAAVAADLPLAPNGLGAQLLKHLSGWIADTAAEIAVAAGVVLHFRALWRSLVRLVADPATRAILLDAARRLAIVLGCALVAEGLVRRALRRPLQALEATPATEEEEPGIAPAPTPPQRRGYFFRPARLLGRLPSVLVRLLLELIPVAVFGAVSVLLLGTGIGASETIRLVIFAIVNAYLLCRVIMCVTRMLVSASSPRLRLLRLDDQSAAYVEVWVRRIGVVVIFGTALAEAGRILGLSAIAHDALERLFGLIADLMLVIVVLQCRQRVAHYLRAAPGARGTVALLRNRLGDIWHYIAIFLILALWIAWAIEVRNGIAQLVRFCAATVAVLIGARLVSIVALAVLDRIFRIDSEVAKRFTGLEERANRYVPLLRRTVSAVVGIITIVALLEVWGVDALAWFRGGAIGGRLVSALVSIAVALAVSVIVWETTNAAIDRHLTQLSNEADLVRAARLRTLLPLLRTVLLVVILAVVGLTALSEIGLNIAPMLAGAGIVGIAVGFGSQKLVQDVITGLFLLLENAMQVGDSVTVAGLSGSVEKLSIRALWLRDGDGSVHVIPFSAVTSVTNSNRGVGNAAVSVSLAFAEDTDRVNQVLTEIAAEMRREPDFKAMMLSDLQLWGVDKVDSTGVAILGQIVCTVSGRWPVQREFNRRMKKRFQELGIEIASPTQTVVVADRREPAAAPETAVSAPPAAPAPQRVAGRTSA